MEDRPRTFCYLGDWHQEGGTENEDRLVEHYTAFSPTTGKKHFVLATFTSVAKDIGSFNV